MFALVGIAWGAMPVNPSRFRRRYDDAVVALAGPLMNLSLFITCIVACVGVVLIRDKYQVTWGTDAFLFFIYGALLNFALMVFNLLPVPPLDGSRIMANVFPAYQRLLMHPNAPLFTAIGFVVVFLYAGSFAFGLATNVTIEALDAVLHMMGRARP
jgi:Zn-dependent protease